MELNWTWIIATVLLAGYVYASIFYKGLNGCYYALKLGKKKHYSLPPGDMGWPLIGNIVFFMRLFYSQDPNSFLDNLVSKYGRTGIYKTHIFGNPIIVVCAPDTCRRVLMDDKNFKMGYPKSLREVLRLGSLYDMSSEEHKRFRRLVTAPLTGHSALAMYLERIEDVVINSLERMASMSEPVEISGEMSHISFNIIAHVVIGSENQFTINKVAESFSAMVEALISLPINVPGFAFHRARKASEDLASIIRPIVDERRRMIMESGRREGKIDLMDILLQDEDETGWKLENEDIVDFLITFLFAGSEGTATSMMWSLIYISENPHVLIKAREEQEQIMKARPPSQKQLSIKDIKQMVYLANVIDETIRRANLGISIFREATSDVEMNGYIIPKGWKALVWTKANHWDPEYYTNPLEFNPSRWEDNSTKPGTFLPFGGGLMHCPGSDLAKLEISILLHFFLLNYKLERVNPGCPIRYGIGVKPIDNCLAKVMKIS
ncbi:beta-amyrin 11-oxidase-like [Abrus precatorius]|uniref:Beta-amyrin 11-oxidase-like n=1 Tax=Abrus precatorius TaxID=3816 RepID=A0A8B8L8J8_ABRPR|nr:beta-amyrin 11-oxidase-like [Abrus precatorius]